MKMKILNRKLVTLGGFTVFIFVSLTGCGITGAQKDTTYGDYAYEQLQEFTSEYPERIACSDTEYAAGDYIIEKLTEIGFTSDKIERQDFILYEGSAQSSSNIIVTVPGKSENIIVVGAHYDCVKTTGTDDNGSGVALLLESAKRMLSEKPEYTIRYVFFGAEEFGCLGSESYIESLPRTEIAKITFMINVDSIAAGDLCYVYGGLVEEDGSISGTEVVECACDIAEKLNLKVNLNPGLNADYPTPTTIPGCSDYYNFAVYGIPYLYFEATNWEIGDFDGYEETEQLGEIMHTKYDDFDTIEQNFPGRIEEHLSLYSELLDYILKNW